MPENYYKINRIQKKLPKIKDEQFEFTGMIFIPVNSNCSSFILGNFFCIIEVSNR